MFGNGPVKREAKPNTQVIKSYALKGLDLTKVEAAIREAVADYGMAERESSVPGVTFDAQDKNGHGVTVYGEARRPSVTTRGWELDIDALA
jgi:hypothetical protein